MRKIFSLLYLAAPSILINSSYWTDNLNMSFVIYIISVYLITIIYVALFFKFNPCSVYVLILGLLLSPLFTLVVTICEYWVFTNSPGDYYAVTWQLNLVFLIVCIFLYALPFTLASIIFRRGRQTV